ncbi:MAG TPA: tetratricopeptide repeat protein [Terriglobia bacterium]|nr:tetratricopeptide repeat protein [Terriglobia bacterium]
MKRLFLIAIVAPVLAAGCGRKIQAPARTAAAVIPEDDRLYRDGLAAFREATPEGYARAADLFRRAAEINPSRCEYSLHYLESRLFLALEQKSNWENYDGNFPVKQTGCDSFESFNQRLQALSSFPELTPGMHDKAMDAANRAIGLDSNDPLNWYVLWKLGPTSRGEIQRAAEIPPDLALIRHELGNYRMAQGEYAEAREEYERALKLSPRHFRSYIGIADSIAAIDEDTDVEPYLVKAVGIAPGFLAGRTALGSFYARMGETEKAVEQYKAALAFNSKYDDASLGIGIILAEGDQTDEAQKYLAQTISLNPGSYKAYYYLGNIWFNRGEFARARAQYEEGLKYMPNFAETNYALGAVLYRLGNPDAALAQFEKVLRINSLYGDAYFSRGTIRLERRQLTDAISDYTRAIRIYEGQVALIGADIRKAESRGLSRKVQALTKKRRRLEETLQNARDYRTAAEAEALKPR